MTLLLTFFRTHEKQIIELVKLSYIVVFMILLLMYISSFNIYKSRKYNNKFDQRDIELNKV